MGDRLREARLRARATAWPARLEDCAGLEAEMPRFLAWLRTPGAAQAWGERWRRPRGRRCRRGAGRHRGGRAFRGVAAGHRHRPVPGRDDFGGSDAAWLAALGPHVGLIEVLNAPALQQGSGLRAHHHEREYFGYLNLGFRLGPSVGHDNHYRTWGTISDARVGVYAPRLTRAALLAALRARRTYASEGRNLRVVFRSADAMMGDVVRAPTPDDELDLTVGGSS